MTKEGIDEILSRGIEKFIDPENKFREKLLKNPKNIIIKFGIDPTAPDIHLGHAAIFRKLRKLQDLGCKIVFLVGDFTAQIGDPTGKSKARPEINRAKVRQNMESFLEQIKLILNTEDKSRYSWIPNSLWYEAVTDYDPGNIEQKAGAWKKDRDYILKESGLAGYRTTSTRDLMSILRRITHARLIERDMFRDRLNRKEQLYMHEMLYPVLQGIDSATIHDYYGSCDLEIGGTDQTFNMMIGRDIMKMQEPQAQEPQAVISMKILEGLDGKEKMSKSLENYISIAEKPNEMFGKIMSIPDSSTKNYFELCTDKPLDEIPKNPRDAKIELAHIIVATYHGEKKAKEAEGNFVKTFQKKEAPSDISEIAVKSGSLLADAVTGAKIVSSKSEWSRLLRAGAVEVVGGEKISDPKSSVNKSLTLKIGKHRFLKIIIR